MRPARYIFINKGLDMSPGKVGAQAAHAETLALDYLFSDKTEIDRAQGELYREWIDSGHYTKFVMEARDAEHLGFIERYLNERGYKTFLVIDEGRTEIAPHSPTALSVELVDKDEERTAQHFGDFRIYKKRKSDEIDEIDLDEFIATDGEDWFWDWGVPLIIGALLGILLLSLIFGG